MNEPTTLDGQILFFTHIQVVSTPRDFYEIACGANWMTWPVQSLCYLTPGPLVRPRQWPQRPYGRWRPIQRLHAPVGDLKARCLLLFRCVRLRWLPDDTSSKHHCDWSLPSHMWLNKALHTELIHRQNVRAFSLFTVLYGLLQRKMVDHLISV